MAEPFLPTYDGAMAFPSIKRPADPEEFSWEVMLGKGQELQQVDAQHAQVAYGDGTIAATIGAELAQSNQARLCFVVRAAFPCVCGIVWPRG